MVTGVKARLIFATNIFTRRVKSALARCNRAVYKTGPRTGPAPENGAIFVKIREESSRPESAAEKAYSFGVKPRDGCAQPRCSPPSSASI